MVVFGKIICLLGGLLLGLNAFSQNRNFYLVSDELLPEKYLSDIDRARRSVAKGQQILEKAKEAEERLNNYQDEGVVKPLKLMSMKERVYRHQLKASSFFYDAHRVEFKALKRYLKKEFPIQYTKVYEKAGEQFYRGSVLRKQGADAVPNNSPLSFIHEAVDYETRALKDLEMIYVFEKEHLTSFPVPVLELDSAFPGTNELKSLAEKYTEVKPEPSRAVQKGIVSKEPAEVFFSIQFLATREPVTEKRARDIYGGSLPVIKTFGDGWYRFSAGKFQSVEKALETMKKEGIHGFVIALNGDKKITINKAKQLLSP